MRIAIAVMMLTACDAPFRRGDLPLGVALGCISIDAEMKHEAPAKGVVLMWRFGNVCDRAVSIDLAAARVFALDEDGDRTALEPYDPRHEIVAKWLPGTDTGREEIEYLPAAQPAWIVVELDGVDRSATGDRHMTLRVAPVPAELLP